MCEELLNSVFTHYL